MPSAGAVSYTMQMAQDNSFTVITAQQSTSATSLPMPAIQYESHYFWRVRAFDGVNNSAWSLDCDFFTGINSTTPAPQLQDPLNGSTVPGTSANLFWTSIPSTWWEVQWSTNIAFVGTSSISVPSTLWTPSGLSPGQTYYWRVRRVVPGGAGTWSTTWSFNTSPANTALTLRCFLQGPLNSGTLLMNDALRTAGLVPSVEPFFTLGFLGIANMGVTIGPGVLSTTGSNAVVDWVLLEARHPSTNVVLNRWSLLLQRDGDVMMPDGSAPSIGFPATQVRLSIRHRNHFGCMSTTVLNTNGGTATLDLTLTTTPLYGTEPTATVAGRRALWAGDTSMNGELRYTGLDNDRDPVLMAIGGTLPTNSVSGYLLEDLNLDGLVKYTGASNDRDIILLNIGGVVPTNTRQEQLP